MRKVAVRTTEELWGAPLRRTLLLATIVLGALASGTTIAVAAPSITFSINKIVAVLAIFVWALTPIEIAIWKLEGVWAEAVAQSHAAVGVGKTPISSDCRDGRLLRRQLEPERQPLHRRSTRPSAVPHPPNAATTQAAPGASSRSDRK